VPKALCYSLVSYAISLEADGRGGVKRLLHALRFGNIGQVAKRIQRAMDAVASSRNLMSKGGGSGENAKPRDQLFEDYVSGLRVGKKREPSSLILAWARRR